MRSIELFAGAGGLGMGLHKAGFQPLLVVEWDRFCCATLRWNKQRRVESLTDWHLLEGDVRAVDFSPYQGQVDLISGGPPCQPFSVGGRHRAYADTRDMFPAAIRSVRQIKPQAFLFENVKGLTRAAFRSYFEYIQLQLEHPELVAEVDEDWSEHLARLRQHHSSGSRSDLHYRVVAQVLNAANYGIPQRRERVFFIGFRDDILVDWVFPAATHSLDALLWEQVHGDYWERHGVAQASRRISSRMLERAQRLTMQPPTQPWRTVRDVLRDLPDPETQPELAHEIANHRFQPGARSYPGHTGSPLDEPAKTLKAGVHGVPGGENMLVRHNGSVRYFTVRESARLQTFPDSFQVSGVWSEAMRQLGNAVPVDLAYVLGTHIAQRLAQLQPLRKLG
ncbi:MAG: DNA (cytosine-5-)-methyltransferase [Oscillochloris sp.]|nr:DNA (cytosine-5-)-methyltransferase [Oscillochloris sp.]